MATSERDGANQTYGGLQEGLHLAGYSFERAMQGLETLLEGEAWREVAPGYDDVNVLAE